MPETAELTVYVADLYVRPDLAQMVQPQGLTDGQSVVLPLHLHEFALKH